MHTSTSPEPASGSPALSSGGERRLGELFDLAPSFLSVLVGPDHIFERINPAYLRLVGDRELLGRPVREALPEVVDQGFVEILDGVYRTGEPFLASELPVRLRRNGSLDGEERFVTFVYQPLRGADDVIEGVAAHGVDVTDHVRAREALAEREQRFRSLIENSDDKIAVLESDGRIAYESPAAQRLLGWTKEEMVGRNALEFVHPADHRAVQHQMARALQSPGKLHRVEHRMLHRDGSWLTFETVGHARATDSGLEIVTNSRDVSARQASEAELREREERFRALVELIPQLVWATTPDGYHDYFNQRWYDYTGMERTGGQGWNWKDYLHPDDYERSVEVWQHSLATGEPYEIEYRFRRGSDGAYRWFIGRALPLHSPDGEIIRWFGTCTDVHDERMALEAAQQSQERFRAVAEATDDVIWEWDIETDALWWNENGEKVFGLPPQEYAPTVEAWLKRVHPDDRKLASESLKAAAATDKDTWSAEYRLIRGDGTVAYVLDRARLVRDASGEATRAVGSIIDLTERQRLEEELRQAQKMEGIGKLAGGIAHDFNNLLTVISNYADMVIKDLQEHDPIRADVEEIRKAAARAASLTRQLLAFGRRQVLQPRELDLNEIVSEMEKMLRRVIGEDIALVFRPTGALMPVCADPGQIEQVIMNLALNARDAMAEGGTLTLATANVRSRDAGGEGGWTDAGAEATDHVVLTVTDTGIGMDEATLAHAFEPFFTTKATGHGTGLGLSMVHGIVEQSGGWLEVDSEPGAGTTFRVFLPAHTGSTRSEPPAEAEPRASNGSGTILLVEDEPAVRGIARRALTRYGYRVLEAGNGIEALARLEGGTEAIDMILTDLVMPGMGGRELAERVQQLDTQPPILFMSGYAEADMLPGHTALHPDARFLEKPFSVDQLVSAVAAIL